MKKTVKKSVLFNITILIFLFIVPTFPGIKTKSGIRKDIKCSSGSGITYSVYLPKNYSEKAAYPLIFALEPGGRVDIPIRLFKSIADENGYIIVCSKNVKNGPWKDLFQAVNEVWKDLRSRYKIVSNRVIAAGFSGGARGASLFSLITDVYPSGIIACGAGLSEKPDYKSLSNSFYYGIVGFSDFNFSEMINLENNLSQKKVKHILDVIPGTHKWPGVNILKRAVETIKVWEMINGKLKMSTGFIKNVSEYFNKYLEEQIIKRKFYFAEILSNSLNDLFKSLKKADQFLTIGRDDKNRNKNVKKDKKGIISSIKEELKFIELFKKTFGMINSGKSGLNYREIRRYLKLGELRKLNNGGSEIKKAMSERLLYLLSVKGWKFGISNYKKKIYKKSLIFMKIAFEANPGSGFIGFYLSKLLLQDGNKKECMKMLKKIEDSGLDISKYLLGDPIFKKISNGKEFKKIIEKMKNNKKDKKSSK